VNEVSYLLVSSLCDIGTRSVVRAKVAFEWHNGKLPAISDIVDVVRVCHYVGNGGIGDGICLGQVHAGRRVVLSVDETSLAKDAGNTVSLSEDLGLIERGNFCKKLQDLQSW